MSLPTIDGLVALYSRAKGSDVGQAEHGLFQQHGLEPLIPLLVRAYPFIRRGSGRASILFRLPRYARVRGERDGEAFHMRARGSNTWIELPTPAMLEALTDETFELVEEMNHQRLGGVIDLALLQRRKQTPM